MLGHAGLPKFCESTRLRHPCRGAVEKYSMHRRGRIEPPLDLLAQVVVSLGDNRRLYSAPAVFVNSMVHGGWACAERYVREGMQALPYKLGYVVVLHNATPIDLRAQSAILFFNSTILFSCFIYKMCFRCLNEVVNFLVITKSR